MENLKLSLAPMEGITTFVYRNAYAHHYGQIDTYYSPFLANKNLSYKDVNDVCPENNQDIHLIPQILTNQTDTFLSIAKSLADYHYKEVNLNLGCPSGTVVAKNRGAGFLAKPKELDLFLQEIFSACPMEISIKTRIGIENMEEWETLLDIYNKYPIKELIIHPRFQKEFYNGSPHREAFVKAMESTGLPLCYNGDINTPGDLKSLLSLCPNVNHIMMGRGILLNPLLPSLIREDKTMEDSAKNKETFRAFHEEILTGYINLMDGDRPVLYRMKELWTYMSHFLSLSEKEKKQIRKCETIREYRIITRQIL